MVRTRLYVRQSDIYRTILTDVWTNTKMTGNCVRTSKLRWFPKRDRHLGCYHALLYYPMDLQVFVSIVSLWFCVAAAVYTRMSEGVSDGGPPAKKTSCK